MTKEQKARMKAIEEEIDCDRWDWYSDWHKDVFGFRPRQTRELGVRY